MEPIPVREDFDGEPNAIALSPAGSRLAIYTENREPGTSTLVVHDTGTGRPIASIAVENLRGIGFGDEDTLLFADHTECRRWHFADDSPELAVRFSDHSVQKLGVHAGSGRVAVSLSLNAYERRVTVCDWRTGEKVRKLPLPYWWYASKLTFSPDGRLLAARLPPDHGESHSIIVWEVATGRQLRVHLPLAYVSGMGFAHGDDRLFVAVESRGGLSVYGSGSVDPVGTVPMPPAMGCAQMIHCPAGDAVIEAISWDGVWVRVDEGTGEPLAFSQPPAPPGDGHCGTLSADARMAAVVVEAAVYVWGVG